MSGAPCAYRVDLIEVRVEVRVGPLLRSVFALSPIPRGTVLGLLTPGTPTVLLLDGEGRVDYREFSSGQTIDLAVEGERLYCLAKTRGEAAPDFINHSCTPNCVVEDRLVVKSARDIEAGEQVTVDYLAAGITLVREGIACRCRPGCQTVI